MRAKLLLVAVVFLAGCSAINATKSMPDKMDQMMSDMGKTNDSIDQQKVQISLENLLDPNNGKVLTPVPFDLMGYALTFGQYATTEQLVELSYLWMQKLNESTVQPGEQVADFNQRETQTYMALEAVCGLLPDAKVQQIINEQIINAGRYQATAMQMLMLRVRFIRDVLLEASLIADGLDNAGKIEQAVTYGNSIDMILRLPYAQQISVDIYGFKSPMSEIKETLDPIAVATEVWSADIRSAIAAPASKAPALTGNANADQALYESNIARENAAIAIIDSKIKSWGGTPPAP